MSLKESNEIAVKIKCELETFYKTVEEKGFKIVDKFLMNDVYFIPNTLEIDKMKKTKNRTHIKKYRRKRLFTI